MKTGTPSASLQGARGRANATRSSLCSEVSARLGVPPESCRAALEAFLGAVVASLAQGRPVMLREFGTWSLRQRVARGNVRNPRTGAPASVPARRVVRFVPHQGMGVQS
jgi:DNA-binding protein HU-beta